MLEWLRRRVTALQPGPGEFEVECGVAERALRRGNFEQARIAYQHITQRWPEHAFAHSRLGRAYLQLGNQTEASCEFELAIQLDPGDPEALYNKGLIAENLGRNMEALECFERAFAVTSPHPEAGLKLADAFLARGSLSTALDLYQRVLDINPNIAEAIFGYGTAAALLGREEEATDAYHRALSVKPDFAAAALKLADASLVRGSLSAAVEYYLRVLNINPDIAEAHCGFGTAVALLGRKTDAMDAFRRALAVQPNFSEAVLKLADLTLTCDAPSKALELYQRALEIDPNIAEAHYGYGEAATLIGRETEALKAFDRAYRIKPDFTAAGLKLAQINLSRGSPATALDLYQRVLEGDPESAEGHYGYGEAAILLGYESDAMNAFRRAFVVKPDFPAAKAVAIFEKLFQTPSARRPRGSRPLICIPIVPTYYRGWLGGQSYLINFSRIVSTMPRALRPRILIMGLWDDERDIDNLQPALESFRENVAVIGIVNAKAELVYSKPTLDRLNRIKSQKANPMRRVVHDLISTIDWTFPILYPLWRVPAIPGPLFWIPDLQHRIWPSFFNAEEVAGRDRDMKALALRPVPIIFSSRDAQQHFREHFANQKCRTYVWHFVSQPDIVGLQASENYQALKLPERFYYTPNQFWRHKDHVTLFHALRRILDSGHNVTFVCTGSDLQTANDEYSRELLQLVESLAIGENLRLLGVLPRADQFEVMRHCCAVIQPSLFEGWSTVVEDARAIGRPIIASDIAVHREQLGDNATYFSPRSAESLASAVISLDGALEPGPAPDLEAAAALDLKHRMQRSAYDFLAILNQEATLRV